MSHRLLSGTDLIQVLHITAHTIKWIEPSGRLIARIDKEQAIHMVRASRYIGKCSPRRCYHMWEADDRKPAVADFTYREGRAMLPAFPVTSRTVDLWDMHFRSSRLDNS